MTSSTYRVIYGDTDQMGVVYYANYLAFFERGRVEYMREHDIDYAAFERAGLFLPVVDAHVRYHAPARFNDLITIDAVVAASTRVTLTFHYRILKDALLLAVGETVHACIHKDGRPTRLPHNLLQGATTDATKAEP
jgi:acyl-CoA thioester hydrolase